MEKERLNNEISDPKEIVENFTEGKRTFKLMLGQKGTCLTKKDYDIIRTRRENILKLFYKEFK